MARPIWTGMLSFGLVTVPVALYSATESHGVSFRQIQRGTADRVRNKRVNERTGEEVAFGDIVKGFELAEGEYVIVEPEELERISPGRSKTLEIKGFVELEKIDPIFFDTTYYLGPRGAEYGRVYGLLHRALARSGKAGLALFAMRGKEYLTAVHAEEELLVAQTMRFADEIRDPKREVDNLPGADVQVSKKELSTAQQLIDMRALDWDPDQWHDTYAEQVRELVQAKAEGREIAVSEGPAEATNVVDLMAVLERSLAAAGQSTLAEEPQPRDEPSGAERKGTGGGSHRRAPKASGAKKSISAPAGSEAKAHKSTRAKREDLGALSKAELYKRATALDIPHRSAMSKEARAPGRRTARGHLHHHGL
ncbi:Ku protein [Kitasatospora sp. NPDC057936]|uniref:non-homologous end joining protein Ku n=1 Tax=Kitasatospora sp. NPDC057936 TaxID=3346283 RepID=UPI0036DBC982